MNARLASFNDDPAIAEYLQRLLAALGASDQVLKPGDPGGLGEAALEAAVRNALERDALSAEVARLSAHLEEEPDGAQTCWDSGASMRPILAMVERVAPSDVSVLLHGESGVGKEVLARELHRRSPRRERPFIKVNCAALPGELLESELFGHEEGAFTGAGTSREGKFETADQGTIMLDEIGEMPVALQAKLLHVLQDHQLTHLGSNRPIGVNVRVIAATNRDLQAMRQAGTFRDDLYYRLQVIEIRVPPLRQRREEIPLLVGFFLAKYAAVYRKPVIKPSAPLLASLAAYAWPGNVRELENMMKRLVVLQDEAFVLAEIARAREDPEPPRVNGTQAPAPAPARVVLPAGDDESGLDLPSLARAAALEAERAAIDHALARFHWNRRKAAQYLHVSYKTLLNKMKECGILATNGTGWAGR